MCNLFNSDLETLAKTGQVSEPYLKHLEICDHCQSKMQSRVLRNIKALDQPIKNKPLRIKPSKRSG